MTKKLKPVKVAKQTVNEKNEIVWVETDEDHKDFLEDADSVHIDPDKEKANG